MVLSNRCKPGIQYQFHLLRDQRNEIVMKPARFRDWFKTDLDSLKYMWQLAIVLFYFPEAFRAQENPPYTPYLSPLSKRALNLTELTSFKSDCWENKVKAPRDRPAKCLQDTSKTCGKVFFSQVMGSAQLADISNDIRDAGDLLHQDSRFNLALFHLLLYVYQYKKRSRKRVRMLTSLTARVWRRRPAIGEI